MAPGLLWFGYRNVSITEQQRGHGQCPRPYLGIASGILGTARNTGMALGIAAAGLILYSLVPSATVAQEHLSGAEAVYFLSGLKYAFLFGAGLSALAALFSLMQPKTRMGTGNG